MIAKILGLSNILKNIYWFKSVRSHDSHDIGLSNILKNIYFFKSGSDPMIAAMLAQHNPTIKYSKNH
jgi:hypothetical protein